MSLLDHSTLELKSSEDGKLHPGRRMTEEEFVAWCDDKTRAEWDDGEVIMMAAVSLEHDDLGVWLSTLLKMFVDEKRCGRVFSSEVVVRLAPQRKRRRADLAYVSAARFSILRPNHIEGAPDLVVEIVSPDSEARDWREKYYEYEQAAVPEYWIFDPMSKHMEVYAMGADAKYHAVPEVEGRIPCVVLPGFFFRPSWIWGPRPVRAVDALRELGITFA